MQYQNNLKKQTEKSSYPELFAINKKKGTKNIVIAYIIAT